APLIPHDEFRRHDHCRRAVLVGAFEPPAIEERPSQFPLADPDMLADLGRAIATAAWWTVVANDPHIAAPLVWLGHRCHIVREIDERPAPSMARASLAVWRD